jgi:hypothetical protein
MKIVEIPALKCGGDSLSQTRLPSERTDILIEELKLVTDMKKNVNTLLMSVMSVFYALNGVLIVLAVGSQWYGETIPISFFGIALMIAFVFIAARLRSTNGNCDERALEIENQIGFQVVKNYQLANTDFWPAWLYKFSLHGIVIFFSWILVAIWVLLLFFKSV